MKGALKRTFDGRTVMVTGHTGFKGSWLSIWLNEMGAHVIGYSLDPLTVPSNYQVSRLGDRITDLRGDIRDHERLIETIDEYKPEVIFHLAAQAIVIKGYNDPLLTIHTNTLGTVNILEAIRRTNSVKALVSITSDKCYENNEWVWGYRENDRLGGEDPYSASKAMAELAIASFRDSFFAVDKYAEHGTAIASTRAGNVIGGGDFSDFRLVPDCMRALMAGDPIVVRNPASVRPWQLMLEPLSGYLWLAVQLLERGGAFAKAWNFGPLERKGVTAGAITQKAVELWEDGSWVHEGEEEAVAETGTLRLNWDLAADQLQWRPTYTWEEALSEIVKWFKTYQKRDDGGDGLDMYDVAVDHINEYVLQAEKLGIGWAIST